LILDVLFFIIVKFMPYINSDVEQGVSYLV